MTNNPTSWLLDQYLLCCMHIMNSVIYNNFGWMEHRSGAQILSTGQQTFITQLIWTLHVAMCYRYKDRMNIDRVQHYYNQSLPRVQSPRGERSNKYVWCNMIRKVLGKAKWGSNSTWGVRGEVGKLQEMDDTGVASWGASRHFPSRRDEERHSRQKL